MKQPILPLLLLFAAIAGCDDDASPPRDPPLPAPAITELVASAMAAASASASATSTEAPVSFDALAGEWEGSYDAKKGVVGMPNGVKDPGRATEDGKVASGPGLVKITILANGDVSGKSQGALGNAGIRGKVDGKMLKASFLPDNPGAPNAMTGVLVGPIKDGAIQAELRVAGGDAVLVRQANFQIKKKP